MMTTWQWQQKYARAYECGFLTFFDADKHIVNL